VHTTTYNLNVVWFWWAWAKKNNEQFSKYKTIDISGWIFTPSWQDVRRPDKTATSTTKPKGKYTKSLTFSTPNCICANYGKLGKPSLPKDTCKNYFTHWAVTRTFWKGVAGFQIPVWSEIDCHCHNIRFAKVSWIILFGALLWIRRIIVCMTILVGAKLNQCSMKYLPIYENKLVPQV
jgi:hypothetical protein